MKTNPGTGTKTFNRLAPRIVLGLAIVAAVVGTAGTATHAQARKAPPAAVEGKATGEAPESRAEAGQAIDAALAAALIGAVAGQFDERGVEVKLDRVHSDPLNLVDMKVEGEGRLRIGEHAEWLPVRVQGVYDSVALSVEQPRITIGNDAPGEDVAATSPIGRSLQQLAGERLRREFAQQPADLHLDKVTRNSAGTRYARIDATGTARFDEGAAPVTVHGLYDTRTGRWLRIAYELTADAGGAGGEPGDLAAAAP